MDKNTEIKFVGQPVFQQVLDLINQVNIQGLINKNQGDRYYKAFNTRTHLISMLDVFEMLRRTRREYGNKPLGPPGFAQQIKLALI